MKSLITVLVLLICVHAHASRIGMAPIERLFEEAHTGTHFWFSLGLFMYRIILKNIR